MFESFLGIYADGMVEHDGHVGQLLKQLDDLGIAENTIVLYTTDNGAELALWPDGAMTPFHGEKGTTWEGGMRVPMMVRWPGVVKPGSQINDIVTTEVGLLEKLKKESISIRDLGSFDTKPAIEAFDKIWLPKAPQIAELRAVGAKL